MGASGPIGSGGGRGARGGGAEAGGGPGAGNPPPRRGRGERAVRRPPAGVRGVGEPQRRGRGPAEGLRAPRALRELRGAGDAVPGPPAVRRAVPPGGRAHAVRVRHLPELPEGLRGRPMKPDRELVTEALGDLHKGETIERAVGRILRRNGGTYTDYVRIMVDVRDLARREKITAVDAARRLAQA